jgi:hypothetical protein
MDLYSEMRTHVSLTSSAALHTHQRGQLQVECSRFILPIPARTQTIAAGRSWLARFPIYTLFQLSATNFCVGEVVRCDRRFALSIAAVLEHSACPVCYM